MTVTRKSDPREIVQHSVAEALSEQRWYQQRKDSITQVAGYIVQLSQIGVLSYHDAPTWLIVALGIVIAIAQTAIIAGTKGAITPSMVERLAKKADGIPTDNPVEIIQKDSLSYKDIIQDRYRA